MADNENMAARRRARSAPAYTIIDGSKLPEEIRDDALAGGGEFGVRVVENAVNGPITVPIFGVYRGEDEAKWAAAREEFEIADDDDETGETDEAREQRLAAEASATADEAAAQQRAAEDEEIRKIAEGEGDTAAAKKAKR